MRRATQLLLPLETARDRSQCGGKAANLARLMATDAHTAPGVVVPAMQLDAHLHRAGFVSSVELFAELLSLDAKSARTRATLLRQAIAATPLDAELARALTRQLASLPEGTRLAVRSSALGEDSAQASFAGVFDTRLGIESASALARAVREVWASLFGERALAYARSRDARPAGMAVVIQTQVDPLVSGVLFTRDPRGESEGLLLECCEGLGERLVSGELSPTRMTIDRVSGKAQVDAEGDSLVRLQASWIDALVKSASVLERAFDGPQDIEWSIDRSGRLVLLQSRPITAGAASARVFLWSNANIAENFPDPVSPFLESFVARGYAAYFRGLGLAFGISRRRLDAMGPALERLVDTHGGRLYYNLSHIHNVIHLAPFGAWLAGSFNHFTGADAFPVPRKVTASLFARTLEMLRIAVQVPWQYLWVSRRLARFEATVDAYAADSAADRLSHATEVELAELLRGFLRVRLERWTDAALADTAAMVCYGALKGLLARWLPVREQAALHNDLLKGLPGLASAAPVEKLWELSRRARADAQV
ncbi:MAG: hypothetical protein OEW21_15455, partial [Betaproteobacteria bacterium]|nr:hypothetical protein [Betaproteobacteria bacterium]